MSIDLKALARLGAEKRHEELKSELMALEKAFPGLGRERLTSVIPKPRKSRSKARRKMSAAARKAVGARMRKYWAERRKTKATQKG